MIPGDSLASGRIQDSADGRRYARGLLVGFLAFLPVLAGWVHKEWVHPRPFWVFWYDPELPYFHASRDLLAGRLPYLLEHPGTPVQLLGVPLVRMSGTDPAAVESFLASGHLLAMGFALASALLLAGVVLGDLPVELQITGIWISYCCAQFLEYANVWSPEAFFFAFGGIAVMLLWRSVTLELRPGSIFLAGLALGVCCALKFTFLPLVVAFSVALAFAPEGNRSRVLLPLVGLSGAIVGFLAATAPVREGYGFMFRWLRAVTTHTGPYDSGPVGVPTASVAAGHLIAALASAKGWYLLLLSIASLVLIGWRHEMRAGRDLTPGIRLAIGFSILGIAGTHVLALRQEGLRYLMPSAVCAVVLFRVAAELDPLRRSKVLRVAMCLGTAFLLVKHLLADADVHHRRLDDRLAVHGAFERVIHSLAIAEAPIVIFSFRAPQPSYALRSGAPDEAFQERLDQIYPREGYYLPWRKYVRLPAKAEKWDVLVVEPKDLRDFPFPTGRILGAAGEFVIVAAPHLPQ